MQPVQPSPHLRRWVLPVSVALGALLVGVVLALPWIMRALPLPSLHLQPTAQPTIQPAVLPEAYREPMGTYGAVVRDPPPAAAPAVVTSATQAASLVPLLQPAPTPPAAFTQQTRPDLSSVPVAVPLDEQPAQTTTQRQVQTTQTTTQRQPRKQSWVVKPTDITIQDSITPSREAQQALQDEAQAQQLIKQALWAKPANIKKTLYRQQSIPGVTMDEIVSSIPGQYRVRVTVPVFNRFYPDYELIPKDTIVIVKQEGGVGYGQERLKVLVDELQPPTPEVIKLNAAVGGAQGQSGLTGHVNNHYGKLILATIISTALNIGPRVLAGSPQGYNYNIGQEVSREAGSQIAQDAKSIVDKQLRVPPTITIPAHTPVSITLSENVTFSRQPVLVR